MNSSLRTGIDARRSLEAINADLEAAVTLVSRLKRERQARVTSDRMKVMRNRPEFESKRMAGVMAMLADPVRSAAFRESRRAAAAKNNAGWRLPPMTRSQKTIYDKVKYRYGHPRDVALAVALGT